MSFLFSSVPGPRLYGMGNFPLDTPSLLTENQVGGSATMGSRQRLNNGDFVVLCGTPRPIRDQRSSVIARQGRNIQKKPISFYVRNTSNCDLASEGEVMSAMYLRPSMTGVFHQGSRAIVIPGNVKLVY
jgi:hypothetical protein